MDGGCSSSDLRYSGARSDQRSMRLKVQALPVPAAAPAAAADGLWPRILRVHAQLASELHVARVVVVDGALIDTDLGAPVQMHENTAVGAAAPEGLLGHGRRPAWKRC